MGGDFNAFFIGTCRALKSLPRASSVQDAKFNRCIEAVRSTVDGELSALIRRELLRLVSCRGRFKTRAVKLWPMLHPTQDTQAPLRS
eukprot:3063801-Amphidinium_carterae.1